MAPFPASRRRTFCFLYVLYDLRGLAGGVGVQQFANLIYDDDGGDGDGDELILSKITLARRSIPAVFLDHVGELYDVLALLVLLAGLEGVLIFPP